MWLAHVRPARRSSCGWRAGQQVLGDLVAQCLGTSARSGCRSTPANPRPVTMPTLAQINWTAAMEGNVTSAGHSVADPSEALATA